jgi:hypothetical protein
MKGTWKALGAALLLLGLGSAGCSVEDVPGRFTYLVKYSVAGSAAGPVDIDYVDETGATVSVPGAALPWSLELPTMAYDHLSPFAAELRVWNVVLGAGEDLRPAIIWKDYRVDFQEEVLESVTLSGPASPDYTLYAPPLPE